MPDIIDKLISNPLYLTIGVILVVVLIYAVMKRIMKLLIFLVIAIILFFVYVNYAGESVKHKVERLIKD